MKSQPTQNQPCRVRRVLGKLGKAGYFNAKKGYSGGWQLAKAPQDISMGDVYLALDESFIASGGQADTPICLVESVLQRKVHGVLEEIEQLLVERLQQTSIADVSKSS